MAFDPFTGKWKLTRGNEEEATAWAAFSSGKTPSGNLLKSFHEGRFSAAAPQPASIEPEIPSSDDILKTFMKFREATQWPPPGGADIGAFTTPFLPQQLELAQGQLDILNLPMVQAWREGRVGDAVAGAFEPIFQQGLRELREPGGAIESVRDVFGQLGVKGGVEARAVGDLVGDFTTKFKTAQAQTIADIESRIPQMLSAIYNNAMAVFEAARVTIDTGLARAISAYTQSNSLAFGTANSYLQFLGQSSLQTSGMQLQSDLGFAGIQSNERIAQMNIDAQSGGGGFLDFLGGLIPGVGSFISSSRTAGAIEKLAGSLS